MIKYETNSTLIQNGQIFVAIKGHTVDGHDYIDDAIKNGASKIICEKDLEVNCPTEVVHNTKEYLDNVLSKEYSSNFKDLIIIGITGTSGKTTSAYLTYKMLLSLGENAAYIGTIGFYNKEYFLEINNTTPDILSLYKLLDICLERKVKYVVMEVSSHSLSYERIKGIKLDVAAFTNLSQDHLDYHGTMDEYLNEKLKILNYLKEDSYILLNSDDKYSDSFKKYNNYKTFGENADYKIINYSINPVSTNLTFSYNNIEYNTSINLTGKFNIYNYLTCISLINTLGFDMDKLIENTKYLEAPNGRCETLKLNKGYAVIDYAHKPDAVKKVLENYNDLKEGKVITIIGCGGNRDKTKRPIMGNIATKYSDYVIFTSDNPRGENPSDILNDIVKDNTYDNFIVIEDRKDAIYKGVSMLEENDILLILGKGHENYQIIGNNKIHFDDKEVVLQTQK